MPQWSRLHAFDQLREEQAHGRVLSGFNETPPAFAPTFKRIKAKNRDSDLDERSSVGDSNAAQGAKGAKPPKAVKAPRPSKAGLMMGLKGLRSPHKADVFSGHTDGQPSLSTAQSSSGGSLMSDQAPQLPVNHPSPDPDPNPNP